MSWDTRIVRVEVRVSVHDEAGVNQDQLVDTISLGLRNAAQTYLEERPKMTGRDGVEVEVL